MSDWDDATRLTTEDEIAKPNKGREQAYLIVIAGNNVGEMHKVTSEGLIIGRGADVAVRLFDDGVSRNHARIQLLSTEAVLEDMGSSNGTFCNGNRIAQKVLVDGDKIQVGRTTILKFTYHDDLDDTFQKSMLDAALRDGLTKVYNKKYFQERLETEWKFAVRHKTNLTLFIFDLDHFKSVNDNHGHLAGDKILMEFAATIQRSLRQEDIFARYGGEEFALLCRSISSKDAILLAERLRANTQAMQVSHDGKIIPVTVSIGIATIPDLTLPDSTAFVASADGALYRSKETGRNRVTAAAQ